jgi:hypothetical protein
LWRHGWRPVPWYALGCAPLVALQLGYNQYYFGTVYFAGLEGLPAASWAAGPQLWAFLGLLVSPSRGMLVFSPFLLFTVYGAYRSLRYAERPLRLLAALCIGGTVLSFIVLASWNAWHAFVSYGSRYSADILPEAMVLMAFCTDRLLARRLRRYAFAALLALSIAVQSLGVYVELYPWHGYMFQKYEENAMTFDRAVWDIEDPQILYQLQLLAGARERGR